MQPLGRALAVALLPYIIHVYCQGCAGARYLSPYTQLYIHPSHQTIITEQGCRGFIGGIVALSVVLDAVLA